MEKVGHKTVFYYPALVTADTQSAFSLVEPDSLINVSSLSLFSETDSPDLYNSVDAFDGSIHTMYDSTNAVCYFGVDFGEGKLASISKIKFFPSL